MKKTSAATIAVLCVAFTLLSGCNTVKGTVNGAGKDTEALGRDVRSLTH